MALSPACESLARVAYDTGTLRKFRADSRVKFGTIAICWWGMREAQGLSACLDVLSTGFSDEPGGASRLTTDGVWGLEMSS